MRVHGALPPMQQNTGYPPIPPSDAAPGAALRRTRRRWLVVSLVIALCALGAGTGVVVSSHNQAEAAGTVARGLCADLQARQYAAVYALLVPSARQRVTQQQFVTSGSLQDEVDGTIRACAVTAQAPGITLDVAPTGENFSLRVTRAKTYRGDLALVRRGDVWQVVSLAPVQLGTEVGPLLVATEFCQALRAGDYAAAYAYTSSAFQARAGAELAYAAAIQNALMQSDATISGCQLEVPTYALGASGDTATVSWLLQMQVGSIQNPWSQTATFVKENGVWKIDSIA